jgi:hypothetical protein
MTRGDVRTHALISLSLSIALAGCSSELSTEDAEGALLAHLREIAPRALKHEVPDSVVSASEILESDEHTRDVRFTVTGTPATGVFQRSEQGWVLTRYGPGLAGVVERLRIREWEAEYADLVGPLSSIGETSEEWSRRLLDRINANGGPTAPMNFVPWVMYMGGPPARELAALVAASKVRFPDGVTWGHLPGTDELAGIAWTMRPDSTMCAIALGWNARPEGFEDTVNQVPACGRRYLLRTSLVYGEDTAIEIRRKGMLSGPPNFRYHSSAFLRATLACARCHAD